MQHRLERPSPPLAELALTRNIALVRGGVFDRDCFELTSIKQASTAAALSWPSAMAVFGTGLRRRLPPSAAMGFSSALNACRKR